MIARAVLPLIDFALVPITITVSLMLRFDPENSSEAAPANPKSL